MTTPIQPTRDEVLRWPPARILAWMAELERDGRYDPRFDWEGIRSAAHLYLTMAELPRAQRLDWGRMVDRTMRVLQRVVPFCPVMPGKFQGAMMGLRLNMIAVGGPAAADPLRDLDALVDELLDGLPLTPDEWLREARAGRPDLRIRGTLQYLGALKGQGNLSKAKRALVRHGGHTGPDRDGRNGPGSPSGGA